MPAIFRMSQISPQRSAELTRFLAIAVDEAPEGIFALDDKCRVLVWNRTLEQLSGIPRTEVLGLAWDALPFLPSGEQPNILAALAGEEIHIESREFTVVDGRTVFVDTIYRPMRDESGVVIGALGYMRETRATGTDDLADLIAAEKIAREDFEHEAQNLDTLLRTAETLTAEMDLEKIVQAATDAGTQLCGAEFGAFFYNVVNERGESYMLYTISGVPREAFSKFPMPRNTDVFAPTFRGDEGVVRSGNIKLDPRYGNNAPRKGMPEGHLPVCSYLAVSVKSRSGEVFGGLFFGHSQPDKFTEESERLVSSVARQASIAIENARLYDSEKWARERAEQSEAKILSIWNSITDAFVFFDRDWRFQFANEKACELAGMELEILLGKPIWEMFPEAKGSTLEHEVRDALRTQKPKHFKYHSTARNLWLECHAYPSADGLGIYLRDVSAERRAAEYAEKAEDRLKLITTTTDVGTWYCDLPFDVLEWSPKTKEHFWLPPDAQVTIETFYERLHPEDRERVRKAITKAIDKHEIYDIDYRTVSDTGQLKWIRAMGRGYYDEHGRPTRFDGITVDQTARRAAEEALRRTERLATAGRLAATVAHELNNPLESITNLIYLCQIDPEASDTLRSHLAMADEELRRVAQIVRQTLGFYRETSSPKRTDVAELVAALTDLYRKRYYEKRVKLRTDLEGPVMAVVIPGAIRQVVANLLSNAADACSPGAEVTVSVKQTDGRAVIEVADTGHGIRPTDRERLFEPFFTTKTDIGTGLGLWVSRGIVEKHGGRIEVDSSIEPTNHGTTFRVALPTEAPAE